MLRVVVDTNIILSSIYIKSKAHSIIQKLFEGKYELYISNEILLEYEEKLQQNFNKTIANNFITSLLILPNVIKIEPLFKSDILKDKDDNKFLDIYYTSKSNYLVTNDKDFNIIKNITFPKHNIITINEFINIISKQ
ncbi:MAG: putative toxin-antitoxin system toxin component, PIN family [Chitinophagales bacterium]|nr:putative toxin-antitoxin system toxin component, PIN family [Chitinophagales bacterium]